MRTHSQSLERLAERGGLSPAEAVAVLEDKSFWDRWPNAFDDKGHEEALNSLRAKLNEQSAGEVV